MELVIFDCDGVLADSEVISAHVLIEELAREGIAIDFGYVRRHFLGRSFPTVAKMIREDLDRPLPADFEMRYRNRLLKRFETELRPTSGVVEVLDALNVAACVATSSSPERVSRTLELLGLAARFGPDVFTASEVRHGKPAPDLFLHAARRMGVPPARTLVIEDSAPGLTAAGAAGMAALAYTGGEHLQGQAPDAPFPVRFFDNWADFPHLFEELCQGSDAT
ncbi:6-phosphogluconate phosphatase [Defluviimonas aquaemixtae]|uniref:6-phosphogluconate phosphatase n=1 Tax=Albidovulum aquaemixtae TaxID=1542388 RepID=A0A2R8B3E4_9RHOB|nr:6-phosphogluconate phosphatase [Defluviimonas aquaemixtae]